MFSRLLILDQNGGTVVIVRVRTLAPTLPMVAEKVFAIAVWLLVRIGIASVFVALLPLAPAFLTLLLSLVDPLAKPFAKSLAALLE
jgi:hypothetical protein